MIAATLIFITSSVVTELTAVLQLLWDCKRLERGGSSGVIRVEGEAPRVKLNDGIWESRHGWLLILHSGALKRFFFFFF